MTPFLDALEIVGAGIGTLGAETVSCQELWGRVLAAPILAPFDLPASDRSAVDGYGLRAADAAKPLTISGELPAGQDPAKIVLGSGQAVRLFTGSGIPPGVDAIVMQEDVRREGAQVFIETTAKPGDFIRRRGAEMQAGAEVLPEGLRVTPPVLSLLASLGLTSAEVLVRPTVRIVATGSELVEPGKPLKPGQIYESITPGIRAAAEVAGAVVHSTEVVGDDPRATKRALADALNADIVITCGGVSVGDHDLVRPAWGELGVETRLWGVAMRPGKPFFYGVGPRGVKVFGLPGNPVSALVTFYVFVRPVLLGMVGRQGFKQISMRLHAPDGLPASGDRDDFLRARIFGERVHIEQAQESHMLTGLSSANALVRLPARSGPYRDGDKVEVVPMDWA